MLQMNAEESWDVLAYSFLLLQALRKKRLISTVWSSTFGKKIKVSIQQCKTFRKIIQSPSNLVENNKCSALPNASFICALGLSLALLPPMLPLRVSQKCLGSCARRKKVNKNKRKSDTGSKSPLQTNDCLLSCPEQLSGETILPETN